MSINPKNLISILESGVAKGFAGVIDFVGATVTQSAGKTTVTISGGGGGITDGDKGDITVSSSGSVWTIKNLIISTAKIIDGAITSIKLASTTVTTQAGTSYTIQASDNNTIIDFTSSSAVTVTIPGSLGAGFSFGWSQSGTGQITFVASGVGVNLRNFGSAFKSAGQYSSGSAFHLSTSEIRLVGTLTL